MVDSSCGARWQSFTQGSPSGPLTSIKLYVTAYGGCLPATITVKLYTCAGIGGAVLQTSTLSILSVGTSAVILPFHTAVTSGQVYTIEFLSPSTGCFVGHDNVELAISNSNTYAGGSSFCCTALLNQDFSFTTYMGNFGWVNLF